ncbi:MAG: PAAR domain-containing protein [Cupriavidus sp.]|nr:PAAR domain-containing protein [Cupriavidus sp.]
MSKPAARVGDSISHGGCVTSGSSNVFINGKAADMAGQSGCSCALHGGSTVSQGSSTVFINGKPASFVSCATGCGASISSGSRDVFIGG